MTMWHDLKNVAESRLLDPDSFEAFTKASFAHKLDDRGMVSTMDVDEVVAAYREHLTPEMDEAHRQRIICQRMKDRQLT